METVISPESKKITENIYKLSVIQLTCHLVNTMTQHSSDLLTKPPCTLPFCQFCTVQAKPTRWRRHRRSRRSGPRTRVSVMGCSNCGAQSHLANACPIYCELCHQSSHPTAMHRCFYCGKVGQHNARRCPDALHYMCQIENLKAVRRLRYPLQESIQRGWRPVYRFDTRCLDLSIDFNNYELYRMIIDSWDLTPREILGVAVERGATEWMVSILRSGELTSEDLASSVGHQLILSAFNDDREDLALRWLEAGGDPNMVVDGCSLSQRAESIWGPGNYFEAFAKALIDAGASTDDQVVTNINDGIGSVVGEVGVDLGELELDIEVTQLNDGDIPHLTEVTEVPLDEISSDSDHSIIDTD